MKNVKLIIILTGVLIVIFAISTLYNGSVKIQKNEINTSTDNSADGANDLKENTEEDGLRSKHKKHDQSKQHGSNEEINVINEVTLNKKGSYQAAPSVSFKKIYSLMESGNLVAASEAINKIVEAPQGRSLQFIRLNTICTETLTYLNSAVPPPMEEIFKAQPLKKLLWDTGYCDRFGTDVDPFYVHLDLARQGDKLAQLELYEVLFSALKREVIDPRLYPIEYNELRYEVIGYLQNLSSQGVALASLKLAREYYTSDTMFLPEDQVLYYYYSFLYEKQASGIVQEYPWDCSEVYCKSPRELYQALTEKEQAQVDRLIQRAGY